MLLYWRDLCLEPILPVAALWRSTCKPYDWTGWQKGANNDVLTELFYHLHQPRHGWCKLLKLGTSYCTVACQVTQMVCTWPVLWSLSPIVFVLFSRLVHTNALTLPPKTPFGAQWWFLLGNHNRSQANPLRSPASYCLNKDVSVWVAPAFIKSNGKKSLGQLFDAHFGFSYPIQTLVQSTNNRIVRRLFAGNAQWLATCTVCCHLHTTTIL